MAQTLIATLIFWSPLAIIFAACWLTWWSIRCTTRAVEHRCELIRAIHLHAGWASPEGEAFERVSFDTHYSALWWGHDWRHLYGAAQRLIALE